MRDWLSSNLARLAEQQLEQHGDHESLCSRAAGTASGELLDRAQRSPPGLADSASSRATASSSSSANCPEVGIAYNALWRAGAVVTPAIFLLPPPELRHILDDSEARVVPRRPSSPTRCVGAAASARCARRLVRRVARGASRAPIVAARRRRARGTDVHRRNDRPREGRHAVAREPVARRQSRPRTPGMSPASSRSLTAAPALARVRAARDVVGLHSTEPGSAVLMRWFDPAAWLELAQEHRTQIVAVVPSMLHLLLTQPLEEYDLSELRYIASGARRSRPRPSTSSGGASRREIREGYGLTETSALVSDAARQGRLGPARSARLSRGSSCGSSTTRIATCPRTGSARSAALAARHAGLLARTGADSRGDPGRLAAHRRPRTPRRGRLPLRRRPEEGPDHPRRLQRLPARCRGGAARASGCRGGAASSVAG